MTTIKDAAKTYESKAIKNISELEVVRTDTEMEVVKFKEGTSDEFSSNITTIEGEDYRVPDSVLKDLKAILEVKPELKTFMVKKMGEGMKTQYTVIPLE